jgi:hypothetical protein
MEPEMGKIKGVRLTKKFIDKARRPEKGQAFLRDSELLGFAVRLTPGSTTFILETRIHGRVRRMKIGNYGPMTLDQAREIGRAHV